MWRFPFLLAFLCACSTGNPSSTPPRYKDQNLPIASRVNDLLGRMTPEEKFWQLFMIPGDLTDGKEKYRNGIFGLQVRSSMQGDASGQLIPANSHADADEAARRINEIQKFFVEETRLGIPIIPFEEALHGLVAPGAASYPVPIALAATWDTQLMHEVAAAIASEAKGRGIRDVLSPVVNVAADPRWGRTEETYGEDPFLASEMGVAFVSAFESAGVITTPKHFVANSGDGGRDSYPVDYSERMLEEYYFPPFRACIAQGGSRSIMTSYNSVNGSPATANHWLLNKKLKGDMHFRGVIISDAGAIGGANVLHFTAAGYEEATIRAMQEGAHVIFQTSIDHHKLFMPPFVEGRIERSLIDSAVARVLRLKFELGLFDNPYTDLSAKQSDLKTTLIKDAALKSIVLLKNEKETLPLRKDIRSITVIGTDAVEARLGGYSRPGKGKVSILDGLKSKLGVKAVVSFHPGPGRNTPEWTPVPSALLSATIDGNRVEGVRGEYFNNVDLAGEPVVDRADKAVDFRWTLYSPDPAVNFDFFSVRWTGKLTAPSTGIYKIGFTGNSGYRLFLDGRLIIDNWKSQAQSTNLVEYNFVKGHAYDLRAEFVESSGVSSIKLVWTAGVANDWKARIDAAVDAAARADAAVVVVGIEEGEGMDRAHLSLPGHQEELISAIAKTGKPFVVALVGGSAITMTNWMDKVPAILDVWYPGDMGGEAVADVLFGDYNPAGRLPIGFPVFEGQLPFVYNHKPTGRNDDYADLAGQPMFPFGFGLSYTSFRYSDLQFVKQTIRRDESTTIRLKVTNVGTRDGEEVVQLYIRDELASVAQPIKQLKGFQRIMLKAGDTREVSFEITPEMLKLYNAKMEWVVEPGDFRIMIGASSRDIRLREHLRVSR